MDDKIKATQLVMRYADYLNPGQILNMHLHFLKDTL